MMATALPFATFAITPTAAQEPSNSLLDLVHECDILAAHPDDAQRMSDGVADDNIVPRLAVTACESAVNGNGAEQRFVFQLGRALLASGQKEKAVEQFRRAADSGYAAAHAYLGDAFQFGYGVKADPAQARTHYAEALKGGFSRAEGQIEMLTFDPANYSVPAVGMIYGGQFDALRAGDGQLRNYVYSFVTALGEECGTFLEPAAITSLYLYRYPDSWKPEDDAAVRIGVMGGVAEYDAKRFLQRHGCEGPVALQMTGNINRFFKGP
jgi:TPR repeat protein